MRKGRYFRGASPREAFLADSYANRKKLAVGDKIKVGSRTFRVVGIVTSPLGGRGSDIYLPLARGPTARTPIVTAPSTYECAPATEPG
ncbi:MAG: ABC transporter permease [Thermoleophilum sp.]|nr:ABC transporter permease [Thermoleophilum sp.]